MINWNLDNNFWLINPLMELYFKDIKDEDITKNKDWSSLRMWCIALMGSPTSPNVNMVKEEQIISIYQSFLKEREFYINDIIKEINSLNPTKEKEKKEDKEKKESKVKNKSYISSLEADKEKFSIIFNVDLDAPLIERMVNITYGKARKILRKWEDKLEEWQAFIEKTPVNEANYEMIGKMMVQSHTMWKQYYVIKKEADAEVENKGLGGEKKTFLEAND